MKKLILILSIVFVTMSSFVEMQEIIPTSCFSECDTRATGYAGTYGWNAQEEFNWFSDCYFTYCSGGGDGQVEFPSGNQY